MSQRYRMCRRFLRVLNLIGKKDVKPTNLRIRITFYSINLPQPPLVVAQEDVFETLEAEGRHCIENQLKFDAENDKANAIASEL